MLCQVTPRLLPWGNGIGTDGYILSRSVEPLSEIYQAAQRYFIPIDAHPFNIFLTCKNIARPFSPEYYTEPLIMLIHPLSMGIIVIR